MERIAYRFSDCTQCKATFRNYGTKALYCPPCRVIVARERKRIAKREDTRSTTMTRNGRGTFTIIKKPTWKNGGLAWDEALPDHSRDVRRSEIHTSSDLLHATPEKSIAMLDRILSGRDTYVG